MKKRTSSMIWIEARKSADSGLSENSLNLDVAFSFDQQLMNSNIYQVAQRSHLRQALASKRKQEAHISGASIQSLANESSVAAKTTDMYGVQRSYHGEPSALNIGTNGVGTTADVRAREGLKLFSNTERQTDSRSPVFRSRHESAKYDLVDPALAELPPSITPAEPAAASQPHSSPSVVSEPGIDIFRRFRVGMDDPTYKVLPASQ